MNPYFAFHHYLLSYITTYFLTYGRCIVKEVLPVERVVYVNYSFLILKLEISRI